MKFMSETQLSLYEYTCIYLFLSGEPHGEVNVRIKHAAVFPVPVATGCAAFTVRHVAALCHAASQHARHCTEPHICSHGEWVYYMMSYERHGVSDHWQLKCVFNSLFGYM